MDLKIKDVAEMLNVSETTVRRWLAEGIIPAYKINHQYRFSRMEIEEWVMKHKLGKAHGTSPFSKDGGCESKRVQKGGHHHYSLFRAIHKGGVYHHIPGISKEILIRNAVGEMAPILNFDAEMMSDLLLDRENLMPTAINSGIAIPHTRDISFSQPYDAVAIVFPEQPIEYGALDGEPVHTLFFLFACDDKRHLNLLAKIAHISTYPDVNQFLLRRPSKEEILSFVKDWERQIPAPREEVALS